MHFRCPNCHQPIDVHDKSSPAGEHTLNAVTCPSCNSRFSLSEDLGTTVIPMSGLRIEHFELLEVLGEGSFGTVYKAWDSELNRHVALKLPRPGTVTAATSRQFLREAQTAAGISDPNVVGVYEIGQHEDSYYIASQYIDGVSLRDVLKGRRLTEARGVELMIVLLRAIQVFHDKGIVHRDLKPGNILMSSEGKPYIADFGLARHENPSELTVTQSGKVVGTILYMSPEQARGEIKSLTNRTDLYSMGVILYELLTGIRPFEATTSRTVLYRIMTEDPPSPRSHNRGVPRDLETICLKSLQKDPQKRYESASAMADDLQRYLDGKPILARPVSRAEKAWKLIQRNRLVSILAMVALVAAAATVFLMIRPHGGTVPVVIHTENGDADLRFVRYDDMLRIPHASGFQSECTSGNHVDLLPGLYRVSARDSAARHHEVWRTVPELPTTATGDHRFPHRTWKIENGTVILQPFRLFADADVADSLVTIKGGRFEAGEESSAGGMAGRHQQSIGSLQVGVNEVSYKTFRRVMDQPLKAGPDGTTFLEEFNRQYGDRSAMPDEMPVTGYPVDVAIVFCELAGGRLPSSVEWEYLATLGGTTPYSTGEKAPVTQPQDWAVLAATATTADTTPSGIRNLCSSVAEYTDSRCLTYAMLYPALFASAPTIATSREDLLRLPELIELRGAPPDWIKTGTTSENMNPRQRIVAPFPPADKDAGDVYARIGWRMVRSAK